MCVFCAAIPATMALGVSAGARQNLERKKAEAQGEQAPKPTVPAGPVTLAILVALIAGSVFIHTQFTG